MSEEQFRNKITWFTFLFSILVIWVHSYNSELFLGGTEWESSVFAIENFIGSGVAQIAVPGFFIMSAYLFFRNFSWSVLERKWTSRIKSVLVPYIVWNMLYYAGYLVASRLPVLTDVVGRGSVPFSLKILSDAILHYIYNPVFWYLYQLILLIILAPVIYIVLKNKYIGAICLLCLLLIVSLGGRVWQLNLDALFYYGAGAFFALHFKQVAEEGGSRTGYMTGAVLLAAATVCCISAYYRGSIGATVLYRFLFPVGLWLLADAATLPKAKEWMTYNFFLYATHFALVRFVNKAGAMILPPVAASPLILYFCMPAAAVALNYLAVKVLKYRLPAVLNLLNGSRS